MQTAQFWIDHLKLQPHPEGGFFKEVYRSDEKIQRESLPARFSGTRNFSTSIYFLLRSEDYSLFHRIQSDELWHYYAGSSLTLYILDKGGLKTFTLGPNPEKGEILQLVIPFNTWFGAKVNQPDSYVLSGCTVSPGFDFNDFEMARRQDLLQAYPSQQQVIEMLT
jgi:predicted cupin superfamily sugar epimerase